MNVRKAFHAPSDGANGDSPGGFPGRLRNMVQSPPPPKAGPPKDRVSILKANATSGNRQRQQQPAKVANVVVNTPAVQAVRIPRPAREYPKQPKPADAPAVPLVSKRSEFIAATRIGLTLHTRMGSVPTTSMAQRALAAQYSPAVSSRVHTPMSGRSMVYRTPQHLAHQTPQRTPNMLFAGHGHHRWDDSQPSESKQGSVAGSDNGTGLSAHELGAEGLENAVENVAAIQGVIEHQEDLMTETTPTTVDVDNVATLRSDGLDPKAAIFGEAHETIEPGIGIDGVATAGVDGDALGADEESVAPPADPKMKFDELKTQDVAHVDHDDDDADATEPTFLELDERSNGETQQLDLTNHATTRNVREGDCESQNRSRKSAKSANSQVRKNSKSTNRSPRARNSQRIQRGAPRAGTAPINATTSRTSPRSKLSRSPSASRRTAAHARPRSEGGQLLSTQSPPRGAQRLTQNARTFSPPNDSRPITNGSRLTVTPGGFSMVGTRGESPMSAPRHSITGDRPDGSILRYSPNSSERDPTSATSGLRHAGSSQSGRTRDDSTRENAVWTPFGERVPATPPPTAATAYQQDIQVEYRTRTHSRGKSAGGKTTSGSTTVSDGFQPSLAHGSPENMGTASGYASGTSTDDEGDGHWSHDSDRDVDAPDPLELWRPATHEGRMSQWPISPTAMGWNVWSREGEGEGERVAEERPKSAPADVQLQSQFDDIDDHRRQGGSYRTKSSPQKQRRDGRRNSAPDELNEAGRLDALLDLRPWSRMDFRAWTPTNPDGMWEDSDEDDFINFIDAPAWQPPPEREAEDLAGLQQGTASAIADANESVGHGAGADSTLETTVPPPASKSLRPATARSSQSVSRFAAPSLKTEEVFARINALQEQAPEHPYRPMADQEISNRLELVKGEMFAMQRGAWPSSKVMPTTDPKVLTGQHTLSVSPIAPHEESRVVRVFLSASYGDWEVERMAILRHVVPFLHSSAVALGFQLHWVDLRAGVREHRDLFEYPIDNESVAQIELKRCLQESASTAVIALLGDRAGRPPLPAAIDKDEYEAMFSYLKHIDDLARQELETTVRAKPVWPPNARPDLLSGKALHSHGRKSDKASPYPSDLMSECYRLDETHTQPVYVRRPRWQVLPNSRAVRRFDRRAAAVVWWRDYYAPMWRAFKLASKACLTTVQQQKYVICAVASELKQLFGPDGVSKGQFMLVRRTLPGFDMSDAKGVAMVDIDIVGRKIDQTLKEQHASLRKRAARVAQEDVFDYHPPWVPGGVNPEGPTNCIYQVSAPPGIIHLNDEDQDMVMNQIIAAAATHNKHISLHAQHCNYLVELCAAMIRHVNKQLVTKVKRIHGSMDDTLLYHANIHARRMQQICDHSSLRHDCHGQIRSYLCTETPVPPYIVRGEKGSGKTSMIALAARAAAIDYPSATLCVRFVDADTGIRTRQSLIESVQSHLQQSVEPVDCNAVVPIRPMSVIEMMKNIATIMPKATKASPMFIILDGIDDLTASGISEMVCWPETLPPYVKLVASARPFVNEATMAWLSELPTETVSSYNILDVAPCVEFGEPILRSLLKRHSCAMLNQRQLDVLEAFRTSKDPLFLKLQVQVPRVTAPQETMGQIEIPYTLSPSVQDVTDAVFHHIEVAHGKQLVTFVCGLLSVSWGITESEMLHALSLNYNLVGLQLGSWSPYVRQFPPSAWARLKLDLEFLLKTENDAGLPGLRVDCHGSIEHLQARYVTNLEQRIALHRWMVLVLTGGNAGVTYMYPAVVEDVGEEQVLEVKGKEPPHVQLRRGPAGGPAALTDSKPLTVLVNGKPVAELMCGEVEQVLLERGYHKVQVEAGGRTIPASPEIEIDVEAGCPAQLYFGVTKIGKKTVTNLMPDMPPPGAAEPAVPYQPLLLRGSERERKPVYNRRRVTQLLRHQMGAEQWDSVATALTSLEYMHAKAWEGEGTALVAEYDQALEHPRAIFADERALRHHRRFIVPIGPYLNRNPFLLIQQALNQPNDSAVGKNARLWLCQKPNSVSDDRYWLRNINRATKIDALTNSLTGPESQSVRALSARRDGRIAAAAYTDGTVRVWSLETSRLIALFQGHNSPITSIAITDNDMVATGSTDHKTRFFDIRKGIRVPFHETHLGEITGLAAAGDRIVTSSVDHTLAVWDTTARRLVRPMDGHTDIITCIASTTCGRVYTGSEDGTVRAWDTFGDTLQLVLTIRAHDFQVTAVGVQDTPVGVPFRRLASAAKMVLKVWDNKLALKCVTSIKHNSTIFATAVTEDLTLITASGTLIRLFEAKKFGPLSTVSAAGQPLLTSMVLTLDGRIVAGDENGLVSVWSARDVTSSKLWPAQHEGKITAIAVTDGSVVVTAADDGTVKFWKHSSGKCVATQKVPFQAAPKVAGRKKNKWAAVKASVVAEKCVAIKLWGAREKVFALATDGFMKSWDTDSYKLLFDLPEKDPRVQEALLTTLQEVTSIPLPFGSQGEVHVEGCAVQIVGPDQRIVCEWVAPSTLCHAVVVQQATPCPRIFATLENGYVAVFEFEPESECKAQVNPAAMATSLRLLQRQQMRGRKAQMVAAAQAVAEVTLGPEAFAAPFTPAGMACPWATLAVEVKLPMQRMRAGIGRVMAGGALHGGMSVGGPGGADTPKRTTKKRGKGVAQGPPERPIPPSLAPDITNAALAVTTTPMSGKAPRPNALGRVFAKSGLSPFDPIALSAARVGLKLDADSMGIIAKSRIAVLDANKLKEEKRLEREAKKNGKGKGGKGKGKLKAVAKAVTALKK